MLNLKNRLHATLTSKPFGYTVLDTENGNVTNSERDFNSPDRALEALEQDYPEAQFETPRQFEQLRESVEHLNKG